MRVSKMNYHLAFNIPFGYYLFFNPYIGICVINTCIILLRIYLYTDCDNFHGQNTLYCQL